MAEKLFRRSRVRRTLAVAGLGARIGGGYATTAARKMFASAERREQLTAEREMKTAEQITERLGHMKGAMMKLGQMASYLDNGLPDALRLTLQQLQASAPPMSRELAESVIREEFGREVSELFLEWDPNPIAAASIGQVHRALILDPSTNTERAVAVKIQYPGVDQAIEADLRNADLLGTLLSLGFKGLDPDEMVAEIRERLIEELDYTREAQNQRLFADFYRGHPYINVPEVVDHLSTSRVLTTDLVVGYTWQELLTWSQEERNRAGETLFRFVFRSLYRFRMFNGDPHPGNYIFHGNGKVSFLDFGLIKHFTDEEMQTFQDMVEAAAIQHDDAKFRTIVENAGLLQKNAPITTDEAGEYFSHFYSPVRESKITTWDSDYATSIVRHTFDRSSPIAQYASVPRAFVFIQRINLGLYALLGELGATGNYRLISEEIWPMVNGSPSTPMGAEEADWLSQKLS
jgi:predicted unusual protein kinase regulating ubiquinone biosynthesis (AarF/ABC1/UbiB family)